MHPPPICARCGLEVGPREEALAARHGLRPHCQPCLHQTVMELNENLRWRREREQKAEALAFEQSKFQLLTVRARLDALAG